MPAVGGLTERVRNFLTRERLNQINGNMATDQRMSDVAIDHFLDAIRARHMNYEDWVGWLQRRSRTGSTDLRGSFHTLMKIVVDVATHLLIEQHYISPQAFSSTVPFYRGLANIAQACRPLWVFTTNHDLCLEMVASANGLPMKAGFGADGPFTYRSPNGNVATLQFQSSPRAAYPVDAGFFADGDTGINLLKLHGSIDTFAWTDELVYAKLLPPQLSPDGFIQLARIIDQDLVASVRGKNFKSWGEVNFNDQAGVIQFLRRTILAGDLKMDEEFQENIPPKMYEKFSQEVGRLDTLVMVGYSFSDEHINKAIKRWHDLDGRRFIILVSPAASDVRTPGFDKGRIIAVNIPATEFFDLVGANVLDAHDQFLKAIRRHPSFSDLLEHLRIAPPRMKE